MEWTFIAIAFVLGFILAVLILVPWTWMHTVAAIVFGIVALIMTVLLSNPHA